MNYSENILALIGNTPIVKLNKLTKGISATVLAKIESSFDVAWLIPAFRQMSATGTPSALCFKINAFCASENISAESSKSSCLTAQGVCYLEAGIAGIRQRVPGSLGM